MIRNFLVSFQHNTVNLFFLEKNYNISFFTVEVLHKFFERYVGEQAKQQGLSEEYAQWHWRQLCSISKTEVDAVNMFEDTVIYQIVRMGIMDKPSADMWVDCIGGK